MRRRFPRRYSDAPASYSERKPTRQDSVDLIASAKRGEKITRFPSVAAMTRHLGPLGNQRDRASSGIYWFNGETTGQVYKFGQFGNAALVPKAQELMGQIDHDFEIPERHPISDMAGAYPMVPVFLSNDPLCMRRRNDEESDRSPVSIYINLTSSCGIRADTIMQRGIAVLALVMALAQERPVSLHVFGCCRQGDKETVIVAEIPTAPLDLATACYALTSAALPREVIYGIMQRDHLAWGGLAWPKGYSTSAIEADKYHLGLLSRLGGTGRDLIIPGTHINDPAVTSPVTWVNAKLAKFRETLED